MENGRRMMPVATRQRNSKHSGMENLRVTVQRSNVIIRRSAQCTPMQRCLRYLPLLILVPVLWAGCLLPAGIAQPDTPSDAVISTNVEAQLAGDGQGGFAGVIVATENGVVTLAGTVQKAERKARAAELARQVKNVRRVKNDLEIQAGLSP